MVMFLDILTSWLLPLQCHYFLTCRRIISVSLDSQHRITVDNVKYISKSTKSVNMCFFKKNRTISDKNCDTRTTSPLIQCWLQVCLLICGLGCLAMLLQAWHNVESGRRGILGNFKQV